MVARAAQGQLGQQAALAEQRVQVQRHAVLGEDRGELGTAGAQQSAGLLVGVLGQLAPAGIAEGAGAVERRVVVVGLQQHDVALGVGRGIAPHAQLQARVDEGAEGLAHHRRQAFGREVRDAAVVRGGARAVPVAFGRLRQAQGGVERHQRIQADQQVLPLVEQHRGVHRLLQRAVDVVAPADGHRWVQAGQGSAGDDGPGDGGVVPAGLAEGRGFAGVEVGRHHHQRAAELSEVVVPARGGEDALELRLHRPVVEQAGGQRAAELAQGVDEGQVAAQQLPPQAPEQHGQATQAPAVLVPGGPGEQAGVDEVVRPAVAVDEGRAHLARRHAVGQARRDERAGRHADVGVQRGEVETGQGLLERAQRADLMHRAQRPATGERQRYPRRG